MGDVIKYLVLAHVAGATLTTVVIFRLDYSERPHAVGQAVIAWLVPLFGPIGILIFQSVVHRNMTTKSKPDPESHYRDEGVAADLYHEVDFDD